MSPSGAELITLRNLQQNFGKTESAFLQQIGKFDEAPVIKDYYKESIASNKVLVEKLQNDATQIFVPLRKIKSLIQKEQVDNIDLTELKREMIMIQNNIQHLRQNSKLPLEVLENEESKLTKELTLYEDKFKEWEKPSVKNFHQKAKPIQKSKIITSPANICPEVRKFMDFVAEHGGHENGWPVEDHNLFLKTRSKTKDPYKIAEFLHTMLPDISEGEIIAHERWYRDYLELRDKQKTAIKNWRENKKYKPPRSRSLAANLSDSSKKHPKMFNNLDEKKKKIDLWKAQKRAQESAIFRNNYDAQQKMKLKEDFNKQKHQKIKTEVRNWRQKRQAVVDAEESERQQMEMKEREQRAQEANKLIKKYQKQDKLYIERKVLANPTIKSSASTPRKKKTHLEVPRDPERLFRPTKQWLMKSSYVPPSKDKKKPTFHLNSIPKLRTPQWREALQSM